MATLEPSPVPTASESFIVPSDSLETATVADTAPEHHPDSPSTEKRGLLEALEQAHAALAQSRSENDDLKEQLEASKREVQDQADQIAMLRGKVEEARRGVMRLQSENRRASQLQLAAQDGSSGLRSAKRTSFILPPTPASPIGPPTTGKHIHRRISSMSDPGLDGKRAPTASPPSFLTTFPDHVSGAITPPAPTTTPEEFLAIKTELASARQALQEATDAREASETAVRALRQFIAENAVGESAAPGSSEGLQGLRLPPLPTDADVADEEASASRKSEEPKRGWGGWLRRESSNTVPKANSTHATSASSVKSVTEEEEVTAAAASSPLTSLVGSWTKGANSSSASPNNPDQSPISPVQQPPTGFRKFSLFGRSTPTAAPTSSSQPSSHTQTQHEPEPEELTKHVPPPLELHRDRSGSVRDSVSSTSDAVEPVSPATELVDVTLGPSVADNKKGLEEFAGERTPTVGAVTGVAM